MKWESYLLLLLTIPGRFVINISTNVRRSIENTIIQIHYKFESLIDKIYEGAEDDIGILDTGLQIISDICRSVEFLLRDFLTVVYVSFHGKISLYF